MSASPPPLRFTPTASHSTTAAQAAISSFPPKSILKANLSGPASSKGPNGAEAIPAGKSTAQRLPNNCLAGQKVSIAGAEKPIKPYNVTLERLRKVGPDEEAFEDRRASTYEPADARPQPTFLEVYCPMRLAKLESHHPTECKGLCNGQPHAEVGPVCRFCRSLIVPSNRSEVKDVPTSDNYAHPETAIVQLVYHPLQALDHLEKRCTLPLSDRQLLVAAFKEIDKHALPSGNTGTQPNAVRLSYGLSRLRHGSAGSSSSRANGSKPIAVKRQHVMRLPESAILRQQRLERERAALADLYERTSLEEQYEEVGEVRPQKDTRDGKQGAFHDIFGGGDDLSDESSESDADRVVEETAGGDDNLLYSRIARHEPPVRPPLRTPDRNADDRKPLRAAADVEAEAPTPQREESVDSTATANQDFYIDAQLAQDDQHAHCEITGKSVNGDRLERAASKAEADADEATSLDLLKSIQETPDGPSITDVIIKKATRVSSYSSADSETEVQEMLSGQRATASKASNVRLSVQASVRGGSSFTSDSRATAGSDAITIRRKVDMEDSEAPPIVVHKAKPVKKPISAALQPQTNKSLPTAVARSRSQGKGPVDLSATVTGGSSSSEGEDRATATLPPKVVAVEQDEKSSEEDSDVPIRSSRSRTLQEPSLVRAQVSSSSPAGDKRGRPGTPATTNSSSGQTRITVGSETPSDGCGPQRSRKRTTRSPQVYAAEPRSGDDSDSSDGAFYVQASWDPKALKRAAVAAKATKGPSARPSTTSSQAKGKGKVEGEKTKLELPTGEAKERSTITATTKSGKKAGAAARKSGRPSQADHPPAFRTPTPLPAYSQRVSTTSGSRRKPPSVPHVTGSKSRRSKNVRQEPVSSESDHTSNDTDSSNVIVPDEVELTDRDTEEEIEEPPRITRHTIKSSPAVLPSSLYSPRKRKRKRIVESSADEIEDEQNANSDSESGSQVVRPRGRLVKAKDYRPTKQRKQTDAAPADAAATAHYDSNDFPKVLESYREILLDSDIDSIAGLRQAVPKPEKALKLVEYIVDVSLCHLPPRCFC